MLGWQILVTESPPSGAANQSDANMPLASWQCGVLGIEWLHALVKTGVATDLGGNGYPNRYAMPAGALLAILSIGIPKHGGPLVIGDDYVQPSGWTSSVKINIEGLQLIDPSRILDVEAWDLS